VRPDDVLAGLLVVADLQTPVPPKATRLAQGRLTVRGEIIDPLTDDGPVEDSEAVTDGAFIGGPSE
jgi:hypothetical protein